MDGLIQRGLLHCVNLIVLSDHGELAATHTQLTKIQIKKKKKTIFFFFLIYSEENWFILLLRVTGMEEASCQRAVFVSDYLNSSDEFSIIQGPAARVRPSRLPDNFFSCESSCGSAALLSVCVICDPRPLFFSSVNYEGLVKDLSVCQPSQMGI